MAVNFSSKSKSTPAIWPCMSLSKVPGTASLFASSIWPPVIWNLFVCTRDSNLTRKECSVCVLPLQSIVPRTGKLTGPSQASHDQVGGSSSGVALVGRRVTVVTGAQRRLPQKLAGTPLFTHVEPSLSLIRPSIPLKAFNLSDGKVRQRRVYFSTRR